MAKINTLNYQTVASWNGSQDLFVVEQPDGTKVATPEQVKQYVLGDMDEVPTQDSENPVKSGGIFSTMAVPKYDATNRREYYEGGAAFDGNIDSVPTEGSSNMVASGGTWAAINNIVNYTVSDITGIHQSITINEFSLRKCGKIAILGLNFNATASISQFTNLFKLPTGIASFSRLDAVGIFATSTPLIARLTVSDDGYVVANSTINTGSYYLGEIVFICNG